MASLYASLLERLTAVPGVRGVAMSQPALLSGSVNSTGIFVQGRTYTNTRNVNLDNELYRLVVSPSFVDVMGVKVTMGRSLHDRDDAKAPKVVMINEAAARKYYRGQNPIGLRFGTSPETTGEFEIVGVLRDTKYEGVREAVKPTMYVPYRQTRLTGSVFEVRTAGPPTAAMT